MSRTSTAKKTATAAAPLAEHPHFVKLDAHLQALPRGASSHAAVLDNRTGLIWAVKTVEAKDHVEAIELAKAHASVNGHDDWRLPTVEELFLLADRSKRNPAIDEEFFPDTPSDWFWSASPFAGDPAVAWDVHFHGGSAYWLSRYGHGFVRAVRGPVARAGQ